MGDEWFLEFVAATRRASGGRWRGGFRGGELRAELRRDGLRCGRAGLASRGLSFGGRGACAGSGAFPNLRGGDYAISNDKHDEKTGFQIFEPSIQLEYIPKRFVTRMIQNSSLFFRCEGYRAAGRYKIILIV